MAVSVDVNAAPLGWAICRVDIPGETCFGCSIPFFAHDGIEEATEEALRRTQLMVTGEPGRVWREVV